MKLTVDEQQKADESVIRSIEQCSETFEDIEQVDVSGLLARIGDSRFVLLGESTHGSSEFYRMRARITKELTQKMNFNTIALEADWPDAAVYNEYIQGRDLSEIEASPFQRFPQWVWRNAEMMELLEWLREYNRGKIVGNRVQIVGLDLYSLYRSIDAVISYLDEVDSDLGQIARARYNCLASFAPEPREYGRTVVSGQYRDCEDAVVDVLEELLRSRRDLVGDSNGAFLEAYQNARLVVGAEKYYRSIFYGKQNSWNIRDKHMFDALRTLDTVNSGDNKYIIWAHNSHVGDARATNQKQRGGRNLGQICREKLGDDCFLIGFGADSGTVTAASHWGGPTEIKNLRQARNESFGALFRKAKSRCLMTPLRVNDAPELHKLLRSRRYQRAVGVIYRPQTEFASHYLKVSLARQFDEYIWFDDTTALDADPAEEEVGSRQTFPFGV